MTRANLRSVSFGDDAGAYDRARPSYPAVLVDDLLAENPRLIADIGCGTGIAGRLFVERGVRVVGVEPDERMATIARRHGIDVQVIAFEDWEPSEQFDLLIAAQSWHWVSPVTGPPKASAALRPGGRFAAFWNSYEHTPEVEAAWTHVYEKFAPELLEFCVTLGTIQADDPLGDDRFADGLRATGEFDNVERRSYSAVRRYATDEWIDELGTHSDHHALEQARRDALFDGIQSVIADLGGEIDVTLRTGLITATRR